MKIKTIKHYNQTWEFDKKVNVWEDKLKAKSTDVHTHILETKEGILYVAMIFYDDTK